MSYFKQNKTTLWILLAVILFNIAAITTIYYKMNCASCKKKSCVEEKGCFQTYLKKELNLTPFQAEKFEVEKNRYHDTVMSVHMLMIVKREFISAEMIKPNPDTAILFMATNELGMLYAKTRKLYLNHYFELSKICNTEQKAKLASIFGNVFCCEGRREGIGPIKGCMKQPQGCNTESHGKY